MPTRRGAIGCRRLAGSRRDVDAEHEPAHGLGRMVTGMRRRTQRQRAERAAWLDVLGDVTVEGPVAVAVRYPGESQRFAEPQELRDRALAISLRVARVRRFIAASIHAE